MRNDFWRNAFEFVVTAAAASLLVFSAVKCARADDLHAEYVGNWYVACHNFIDTKEFNQCTAQFLYSAQSKAEAKELGGKEVFLSVGWNGITDETLGVMSFTMGSRHWSVQDGKEYLVKVEFPKANQIIKFKGNGKIISDIHGVKGFFDPDWVFIQYMMEENAIKIEIEKRDFGWFSLKGSRKAIDRMVKLATKFREKEYKKPKVDQFGVPLDTF